ncbi:hypothetical protein C5C53_06000 [Rathayibacter sp. AY1E3]|uniref:ATP-dependent nuclease n=1 Tax=Rathayibacter sp. AY1E3 TaxID=2080551 RepID=UPI000CE8E48E|nr:ATP-binding protein [Rathayibacter sp. AY1E3]PPH37915.1 hypothetical protein C5C53_06000 [Rathayibacter sp. AY1E3]
MRINQFKIVNYRGLELASADRLDESPLTLLTGRNGTGKSLILEALTALWSGNINLPEFVGPYGNALSISIALRLDESEYEAIDKWRLARGMSTAARSSLHQLEAVSTNKERTGSFSTIDDVVETLRNDLFAQEHPFATIDLLSARRQVSVSTSTSVDLNMLDRSSSAQQRRNMYEQEIRWKSGMQMPDVGSYLTSLDYRDFISRRQGVQEKDEYGRLVEIFFKATGKKITLPQYDPETTHSAILVKLPSDQTHGLADLSNGEREMLGMLYYVSQLSAQGGVLLLDEPEKHLHPSLQLAVLRAMTEVADRGQILVVTHSPALIASAAPQDVLVVNAAWKTDGNQISSVVDDDQQADVLLDLGIARRDLIQADMLIVVEGGDDERRIKMLFPEEVAGARFLVAGSRYGVLQAAATLRRLHLEMPWICVIDRDFSDEDEVAKLTADKRVFVWEARMIENVLLSVPLLTRALAAKADPDGLISGEFSLIIDSFKEQAKNQFVEASVRQFMPEVSSSSVPNPVDRIEKDLLIERDLWAARADAYAGIRADVLSDLDQRWTAEWHLFVDGKRVLAEIQRRWPVYKNTASLVDNLLVFARESSGLMPKRAIDLKDALIGLKAHSALAIKTADVISDQEKEELATKLAAVESPDDELNASPQFAGNGGC